MARIAIALISLLALAGCSSPAVDDGTVKIVASTDVYGSIATAIGGDHVTVTSLIEGAARDPHSFEASVQDQLAVSKADLVIENGGGYDPFVFDLYQASGSDATIVRVVDVLNLGEGGNEHLWYSLEGMATIADTLAAELTALDPAHKQSYQANSEALTQQLDELASRAAAIAAESNAMMTEPVPAYLLELAGLTVITPDAFTEAVEEGGDVSPAVLTETLDLVPTAALLAYNSQTASAETEQLRAAAETAGVPVVEFSETLPDGADYVSWMTDNLERIAAALQP